MYWLNRYGSSRGHKRTELGIRATAGYNPAFPEVPSCVNAHCYCSPSSSVPLSSGMSDSCEVGVGGNIPSPSWLVTTCPAPQCYGPSATLCPLCFWKCWASSTCLELIMKPGKDDCVRESSSYHLILHEKGLEQHKVFNYISGAIDPM